MASSNVLADALGVASTTGLEAFEISQGAPVSVSSVNGVGSVQVGSPTLGQFFTGLSGTALLVIGAIIIGAIFLFRGRS